MMRLDIHGMRAKEAVQMLRVHMPLIQQRGYHEVVIVHGKGTGTLRRYVRSLLRNLPYVKGYRTGLPEEGGDGVTVAVFN